MESEGVHTFYDDRYVVLPSDGSGTDDSQFDSTCIYHDFDMMFSKYSGIKDKYFNKEIKGLENTVHAIIEARFSDIMRMNLGNDQSNDLIARLKEEYIKYIDTIIDCMVSKKINIELVSFKEIKVRMDHQKLLLQRKISEFVMVLSQGLKEKKVFPLKLSSNISYDCYTDDNGGIISLKDMNTTEDSWTQNNNNSNININQSSIHQKEKTSHLTAHTKSKFTDYTRQILDDWVSMRKNDPYPTIEEKSILSELTGLSIQQINTWFVNFRIRKLRFNKGSRRNRFCLEIKKSLLSDSRSALQ